MALELPDCGDSSCCFAATRGGMRTNGGCRCFDDIRSFGEQRELLRLARSLSRELRRITQERDEARRVAGVLADALATHEVDEATVYALDIALSYPDKGSEK